MLCIAQFVIVVQSSTQDHTYRPEKRTRAAHEETTPYNVTCGIRHHRREHIWTW